MKKTIEKPFKGVDTNLFPPEPHYGQVTSINKFVYVFDGHHWQLISYRPVNYYAVLVDNMLHANGDNELMVRAVYEIMKVQRPTSRVELWVYEPVLLEHNEPVETDIMDETI